ncbi:MULTISPECIES: JDVT-CTERM system glutamic-type intramembrane protease [unclassified Duganella]|uniref:JDVT-CTERM system glutamic-type intramembrane protease MrtJ n=1 Tax=unclassified Duganella TaxID=2636909 RepID=UPI001E65B656|nr:MULTISPECIES: JDVT-CTERM system glutamic-type intramembrane protease [unclassified Duganella]
MSSITHFCSTQLQAPDLAVCLRLLLLSPALEECVVRAGLQEWMTRQQPLARSGPVLVSTAVFGLLHIGAGWQHALAVLAPGLALALLYQRSRSWTWCALAHSGMNAFAISVCGF